MTKHYFCHAEDANGDSLDWFVEANDQDQALELWCVAVDEAGMDFDPDRPLQIWELPALTGKPSTINWFDDTPEDGRPFLTPVVGNEPQEAAT